LFDPPREVCSPPHRAGGCGAGERWGSLLARLLQLDQLRELTQPEAPAAVAGGGE
jgi:hypothetical protein